MAASKNRLRAYVDANVLLSGAATENPSSASRVVLVASELTLLDLVACERVLEECDRNLERLVESEAQLQGLRETLEEIVSRSMEVVQTPSVEGASLPDTDPKDRVHLFSAVEQGSGYLVTLGPEGLPGGLRRSRYRRTRDAGKTHPGADQGPCVEACGPRATAA